MLKYDTLDKKILKMIKEYISEHGYAPSIREIQTACSIGSTSTTKAFVDRLISEKKLATDHPGCARALRVVGYKFVRK